MFRTGLILAALVAMACACQRRAPVAAEDQGVSTAMLKPEQDRGLALCTHYVERVCACAESDPTLARVCELGRGQPEALRLHLSLIHGSEGKLNDSERRLTEAAARKVIAACVKADAALSPETCPRR